MLTKRLLVLVVVGLPLVGCSTTAAEDDTGAASGGQVTSGGQGYGMAGSVANAGGRGGTGGLGGVAGDDSLVVPVNLSVSGLAGGTGDFTMLALTLQDGPDGPEVFAALRNDGDMIACDAGLGIELYDMSQSSVGAGIGTLQTTHLYGFTDGSGNIASCVGPGDVTMAALTNLPSTIVVDEVGYVVYHCNFFALNVVPIDGFTLSGVESVPMSTGTAYTGTFVNGLSMAVSSPSVTVFPVNSVGRPLGTAIATGTDDVLPGGSWAFETNAVDVPGVSQFAYPTAMATP